MRNSMVRENTNTLLELVEEGVLTNHGIPHFLLLFPTM